MQTGKNEGWNKERLKREVAARLDGKYKARAENIARTELGKLNSAARLSQYKEIGITYYRWLTTIDGRERDKHRAMNGVICSVSDKDVYYEETPDGLVEHKRTDAMYHGNPGEDFQCRCSMVAWDPEIDGLYEVKEAEKPAAEVRLTEEDIEARSKKSKMRSLMRMIAETELRLNPPPDLAALFDSQKKVSLEIYKVWRIQRYLKDVRPGLQRRVEIARQAMRDYIQKYKPKKALPTSHYIIQKLLTAESNLWQEDRKFDIASTPDPDQKMEELKHKEKQIGEEIINKVKSCRKDDARLIGEYREFVQLFESKSGPRDFRQITSDESFLSKTKFLGKSKEACDGKMRPEVERLWKVLPKSVKEFITDYTRGSGRFNRPLKNKGGSWDTDTRLAEAFKIVGGAKRIRSLDMAIESSATTEDMMVRRGADINWVGGLLGRSGENLGIEDVKKLIREAVSTRQEFKEIGFTSTSITEGDGFHRGEFDISIVVPKGTKAIYAEPWSAYTDNGIYQNKVWDGNAKQSLETEMELILARKTSYRIYDYDFSGDKLKIKLAVVAQD